MALVGSTVGSNCQSLLQSDLSKSDVKLSFPFGVLKIVLFLSCHSENLLTESLPYNI